MSTYSVQQIADLDANKKPAFNVSWHPALMAYASQYTVAAQKTAQVTPCMLAAIANRETGGTNELQIGVPPGPGCGVGITQITAGVDWSNVNDPVYPGYGSLMDTQVNLTVCAVVFLEPHEPGVLDAVGLGRRRGEDDPLRDMLLG